jgi:glycosyltransferase involved in cell wall biosynthesis
MTAAQESAPFVTAPRKTGIWSPWMPPGRILMLVPHEPSLDPRIQWVTNLCRRIGATEVLGVVPSRRMDKPVREYDGRVYLERIRQSDVASPAVQSIPLLFENSRYASAAMSRYVERESARPSCTGETEPLHGMESAEPGRGWFTHIDHQAGALCRFLSIVGSYGMATSALYRRGRALSVPPRVIVCHDMAGLAAGVRLKELFRCPVLYDAHECWPEADLLSPSWQRRLVAWWERRLVDRADVVITVTPQLARHMEKRYGISGVLSVPNAAPRPAKKARMARRSTSRPVQFLFQGQAARGRGIEQLLDAWRVIDPAVAVLALRCPENEFVSSLRARYQGLIDSRKLVMLPAVEESDLISAADTADVGIIPYGGPNLNHALGCPNKLSQYMQAGLAILATKTEFVGGVLDRYDCGTTYDPGSPASIQEIVRTWSKNPAALEAMKRNAIKAAETEFNWESQSVPYSLAIRRLWSRANSAVSEAQKKSA